MAEDGGRSSIPLSTVIMIVTMFAGLAGTWSVMGERIANQIEVNKDIQTRLREAERSITTLEIRMETMQDALNMYRREQND